MTEGGKKWRFLDDVISTLKEPVIVNIVWSYLHFGTENALGTPCVKVVARGPGPLTFCRGP